MTQDAHENDDRAGLLPRRWTLNTASVPFDISNGPRPTEPTEVMPVAEHMAEVERLREALRRIGYGARDDLSSARMGKPWDGRTHGSDGYPVGAGPSYMPLRASARELLPLFDPGAIGHRTGGQGWGAGPFSIYRLPYGHELVVLVDPIGQWRKSGVTCRYVTDVAELRAAAISLIVYCEAQEGPGDA